MQLIEPANNNDVFIRTNDVITFEGIWRRDTIGEKYEEILHILDTIASLEVKSVNPQAFQLNLASGTDAKFSLGLKKDGGLCDFAGNNISYDPVHGGGSVSLQIDIR